MVFYFRTASRFLDCFTHAQAFPVDGTGLLDLPLSIVVFHQVLMVRLINPSREKHKRVVINKGIFG